MKQYKVLNSFILIYKNEHLFKIYMLNLEF